MSCFHNNNNKINFVKECNLLSWSLSWKLKALAAAGIPLANRLSLILVMTRIPKLCLVRSWSELQKHLITGLVLMAIISPLFRSVRHGIAAKKFKPRQFFSWKYFVIAEVLWSGKLSLAAKSDYFDFMKNFNSKFSITPWQN